MTEFEKMTEGDIFNPSHISFLFPMLKSEILQRKFNRTPLWFQGRRDRIFKKLVGSIDGSPLNVFSPLKVLYGKNIHVGKNFFGNSNMYLQDCGEIFIGDNSVIGAGSVVTRDIPPNILVCGVPCKVVREITEGDKIGVL